MKSLKVFGKRLLKILKKPEMSILPGQLAFFFILSIVPIFSLVGIFAGFFENSLNLITEFLAATFPADISSVISTVVMGKGSDMGLIIFLVISFFIASNGAHSIIISSNELYGIDNSSNALRRRVKAVFLTIIIVFLFLVILAIPVFGNNLIDLMKETDALREASDTVSIIFKIIKWPFTILYIFFNIKLIYTFAPDNGVKSQDTTTGALLTTILWMIATSIFTYYISKFGQYDIFYGSISNIIILMLWLYILAYIFVLGIALNVSISREKLPVENSKKSAQ